MEPLRCSEADEKVDARVHASDLLHGRLREMIMVVVAYEDGVEGREVTRLAGGGREALGSHRTIALLKDRVKQGAKAGWKLDKAASMTQPRCAEGGAGAG